MTSKSCYFYVENLCFYLLFLFFFDLVFVSCSSYWIKQKKTEVESKAGLEQMKLLYTLLLGAAVQCPNKQFFISRIKELDVDTQHAIVDIIKSVTDSQTLVLNTDTLDSERR